MIPVIIEIDAGFLGLFQIPDITLTCRTEPNASRLIYSALTWTRKFSCKINSVYKNNKLHKQTLKCLRKIRLDSKYREETALQRTE